MLLNCISHHIAQKFESHLPVHTTAPMHAFMYIYIYPHTHHACIHVYIYTHTHTLCNSLEYGFQTFEDVYISYREKFKNLCSACVHLYTTHQRQYWGLAMGWMSKEQQFDPGCELQIYLLYQDIQSSFRALSALYSMVPRTGRESCRACIVPLALLNDDVRYLWQ